MPKATLHNLQAYAKGHQMAMIGSVMADTPSIDRLLNRISANSPVARDAGLTSKMRAK